MSDCPRIGKFWKGCRFEARYDTGKPTIMSAWGFNVHEEIEASKPKTYVKDVCVTCGKTVMRDDQA